MDTLTAADTTQNSRLTTLEAEFTQEAVTTPTLTSPWATVTGFTAPRYWKDPFGNIHIEGHAGATSPTPPSTIFTLNSGYRPATNPLFLTVAGFDGGTGYAALWVKINTNGTVQFVAGGGAFTPNLSLDGVTFRP